ncbi:MAG: bifunctional glutamate N-acetyltransferase/amino-acid acetyltransferase ArgJ [Vicinamibacterales bacterium]
MSTTTLSTPTFTIDAAEGGVTAPAGFSSAALHCGIKFKNPDLALLAADQPAAAAGLFTTNLVKAAPVLLDQAHLKQSGGRVRAIVVNSGCANACTGDQGTADAAEMASLVGAALGCPPEQVMVCSTGVIGVNLKMDALRTGIPKAAAALTRGAGLEAATAIMTTDRGPKQHAVRVRTAAGTFTVGGMAKGAGMIEPNMATMLGFLTTDAAVEPALLRRALIETAKDTFNAITIDGDTSTNDSLFALASGASGVTVDEASAGALVAGLTAVAHELAIAIVRGGEGVTKLVGVRVHGAATESDARRVAKTIANSLLVKTAIHGADPNWGRILAASGRAGVPFDPLKATVHVGDVLLFENGLPHDDNAPLAATYLEGDTIRINVNLASGTGEATVWTCDLSAEYVRINGEYRT